MIIMELIERMFYIELHLFYLKDNFLEGSLNTYLKQHDVRVSQLIQMCYDIAKGMAYLEQHSVIHR